MHITIINYIVPQTFQDNKTDSQTNNPAGGAKFADNRQNDGYRQDNKDIHLLYAVPENLNPDDDGSTADKYNPDDGYRQDNRDLNLLYAVPENLNPDDDGHTADKYDPDDGYRQDNSDLKLLYAVPENFKGDKSGNSDDDIYYPIYSVQQPAGTMEV